MTSKLTAGAERAVPGPRKAMDERTAEAARAGAGELAPEGEQTAEAELAVSVLDCLLREDYAGLARWVRTTADGPALELPGRRGLVLPLRADGFLADLRIARPGALLTLDDVAAAVEAISDARDAEGVAAFGAECRQALASLRLRRRQRPAVRAGLRQAPAGGWRGYAGAVRYDALAAAMPHPAYPTSACRLGFSEQDSLRYAPEYRPEFTLSWVAIPRGAVRASRPRSVQASRAGRPVWWPEMTAVGLPASLTATHDLMPVHPLTARRALPDALAESGLATAGAAIAPGRWLQVRPTLSTRTVAVTGHCGAHLKLPLTASTLGLRNRRTLGPGTLADGALVYRVLAGIAARDPGLRGLLLADDGDFAHAGHPCLGYLLRRLPRHLDADRIVPVGALLAPSAETDQGLVIDELARDGFGGDPVACFGAYLDQLFGIAVRLFARYGIALESHQQNAAIVARPGGGPLRLLVKDFDGALINHDRLTAAMGPAAPDPSQFADQRLLTGSDDALADVFITITVHLCAGAIAFGLAERGYAALPELLALIRRALAAALDRHDDAPAARLLRARVLMADRLPGKAMVTAGTLMDKSRTGARDINKFYGTTGPNYLKGTPR